jgi:hypothetical protein
MPQIPVETVYAKSFTHSARRDESLGAAIVRVIPLKGWLAVLAVVVFLFYRAVQWVQTQQRAREATKCVSR